MAIYNDVPKSISFYNIQHYRPETFEKCSILVKVKEGESRHSGINRRNILNISSPVIAG